MDAFEQIPKYVGGKEFIYKGSQYWGAAKEPPVFGAFTIGVLFTAFVLLIINHKKVKPTLDPTSWQQFPLMDKKEVSPNTARYRFRLPRSDSMLGLPIGQHLSVQVDVNGKLVQRSYTPTTSDDEIGFFDLVVKTYPDGAVSSYIGAMKIGDMLQVKGPKGQMRYHDGLARKIGMVAGGTGLTPCMQIIRQILKDDDDNTQVSFIYANTGQDDILLKQELDEMAEKHPEKFRIWYFLSNPPEGWKGGEGLVSKDAIQEFLPEHAPDTKILMCGPPPMINACKKHLCELGFPEPRPISKPEDPVFCF